MAVNSTFTPKASLTEAPTNLKEAIDWVLRVTGRDGKKLGDGECICGLAAAVTDLLQSVELEYHGYQGEGTDSTNTDKGASHEDVTNHLNGLFSLVQGLGGTAVVRTYIDQLAQVLSALVGWSRIDKCWGSGGKCTGTNGDSNPHGQSSSGGSCEYLNEVTANKPCDSCGCMKWNVTEADGESNGHHLGRGCTKCKDSGTRCSCTAGDTCTPEECKCAKEGKCCKCCCTSCKGKCKDAKCICSTEEPNGSCRRIYNDTYQSAYGEMLFPSIYDDTKFLMRSTWIDLLERGGNMPPSQRRHQCAQILLGSVCLIWSGLTYMYWTGKYHKSSPRWNNHILDGSGLDDGTLSQWLQALGFPREMLNNHGPKNRLDKVIWDGISDKLLLGFAMPSGLYDSGVHDTNDNTARQPAGMNYPGFIHTAHRDSFNEQAIVFKNGSSSTSDIDQHKQGALFKLYILSCAYFTGLQKKNTTESTPRTPKTIREILYWLSALPYSEAYPKILQHSKERLTEVTKKTGDNGNETPTLAFHQTGRTAPITVHEYNLFAHFQAVTQYCPLVLLGIQGGLKGTDKTLGPAIHSLYANTECHFTYPTVSIQAYNQVVHYIRALFYQLYFLRKQCAVKVTCGGKWRECRYGSGVLGKDVVSWMCLGCDPMEHDRKNRVGEMKKTLGGVKEGFLGEKEVKEVLEAIGNVVVQLGNAQEALERKDKDVIEKVKDALGVAKQELEKAKEGLKWAKEKLDGLTTIGGLKEELKEAMTKLDDLTTSGGRKESGSIDSLTGGEGLGMVTTKSEYDPGKNRISEVINKVHEVLKLLYDAIPKLGDPVNGHENVFNDAMDKLKDICSTPMCPACHDHSIKCGKTPVPATCDKCHQQYMDGFPSPLQAFLEDRLPGFSCQEVLYTEDADKYPPAASHLEHCGGSGQCCPLPMGFRGQFQEGITHTGKRLYGILYFFSNENMMQSCVYTLVRVTAALSATTPQVLGDVFGFFRGGVGNPINGEDKEKKKGSTETCKHTEDPKTSTDNSKYFCGWCASGLRDVVKEIEWIPKNESKPGGHYMATVGDALIKIKGEKDAGSVAPKSTTTTTNTSLSRLTKNCQYLSPLTGELYTAVSATFGGTYLSWVLYLSDALEGGLKSLSEAFRQIECRGCKGNCDPNKCKKGEHGQSSGVCQCQSIVSCTGVLPVLYRHGFSYGNPFNLEGYEQKDKEKGDYSIERAESTKHCHEFLDSLGAVIKKKEAEKDPEQHPLTNLLSQVGALQYDIRLPWIFVLTLAWLVAVLYLAFGAIWPLDWIHMRSHWLRGGEHQWQCMWYKVMTGRKGVELIEYFERR